MNCQQTALHFKQSIKIIATFIVAVFFFLHSLKQCGMSLRGLYYSTINCWFCACNDQCELFFSNNSKQWPDCSTTARHLHEWDGESWWSLCRCVPPHSNSSTFSDFYLSCSHSTDISAMNPFLIHNRTFQIWKAKLLQASF